jgi:Homeodomain-like domain
LPAVFGQRAAGGLKRIYRILRELYANKFSWRQLSPEQEARQVHRGRNLARHKPWGAGRIGKIEYRVHTELICARGAISIGELVRKIYCHCRVRAFDHPGTGAYMEARILAALKARKDTGDSIRKIAARFGIDPSTVQRISRLSTQARPHETTPLRRQQRV